MHSRSHSHSEEHTHTLPTHTCMTLHTGHPPTHTVLSFAWLVSWPLSLPSPFTHRCTPHAHTHATHTAPRGTYTHHTHTTHLLSPPTHGPSHHPRNTTCACHRQATHRFPHRHPGPLCVFLSPLFLLPFSLILSLPLAPLPPPSQDRVPLR